MLDWILDWISFLGMLLVTALVVCLCYFCVLVCADVAVRLTWFLIIRHAYS